MSRTAEQVAEWRRDRRRRGLCVECGSKSKSYRCRACGWRAKGGVWYAVAMLAAVKLAKPKRDRSSHASKPYRALIDVRLCVFCRKPNSTDGVLCSTCAAESTERQAATYKQRQRLGLCRDCGIKSDASRCDECAVKRAAAPSRQRPYRRRHEYPTRKRPMRRRSK